VQLARVAAAVVALGASGCFGAPGYTGPETPHFDGTRFHNVPASEPPGVLDLIAWKWNPDDIPWPEAPPVEPVVPPPVVERGIRATLVNHATVLVQIDGVAVLTDPIWSDRVGPVSFVGPARWAEPGVRLADLPRIDAMLVSHDHYDHCDTSSIAAIHERDRTPTIAGLGTAALLEDAGIGGGIDLDWWQGTKLRGGVTVTLVPTRHWSRRGVLDQNTVLWGGFVIEGPSGRVYFAGDTGYGPHFAAIRARLGPPTLAILPIGAYEPRWFMRSSHMGPDEAVLAHRDLQATRSIGVHWWTFDLSDEGRWQPAGELALALDAQRVPRSSFTALINGQSVAIDP
jgi:L-ascorbate metabolism protein UlaG (beta-lactamase superfamily)